MFYIYNFYKNIYYNLVVSITQLFLFALSHLTKIITQYKKYLLTQLIFSFISKVLKNHLQFFYIFLIYIQFKINSY